MAFEAKRSGIHPSTVITIVAVGVIGVSALVISGNFASIENPLAPLFKPQASAVKPKTTEHFIDLFKDGTIATDKWTVNKTGDAAVTETGADNLRINIPAGAANNKAKTGTIAFKEIFKDKGDFRSVAVLYRPVVTGEGTGVSGMRFSSTGGENDEGATIRWIVNKPATGATTSKASFFVTDATGKVTESQQVDLTTNVAIFQLIRVNKQYRAYYKVGSDTSADVGWTQLGTEQGAGLGQDGRVSFFAHNAGIAGKFPQVVARFDHVNIGWEGKPAAEATVSRFADAFANGVLGKTWKASATAGTAISETTTDNLNINVPATSPNNKPGRGYLIRTTPVVASGKNIVLNASMFKPKVIGEGTGTSGIAFVSNTSADDEDARIQWVVSGTTSKLVFLVRNPDGSLAEKASANVTAGKLTLGLRRNGQQYTAWYRSTDNDADWIKLGTEQNGTLGGDGRLYLFTSNVGANKKFPHVIGRFDLISGTVAK